MGVRGRKRKHGRLLLKNIFHAVVKDLLFDFRTGDALSILVDYAKL